MIGKIVPILGTLSLIGGLVLTSIFAAGRVENTKTPEIQIHPTSLPMGIAQGERVSFEMRPGRPEIYYDAILARPLFTPSRRPITTEQIKTTNVQEVATPTVEISRAEPLNVVLGGVLGNAEERKALILFEDQEPRWLSTGDEIKGWQITKIENKRVIFSADTRTFRLELIQ